MSQCVTEVLPQTLHLLTLTPQLFPVCSILVGTQCVSDDKLAVEPAEHWRIPSWLLLGSFHD